MVYLKATSGPMGCWPLGLSDMFYSELEGISLGWGRLELCNMEKGELLRILVIFILILFVPSAYAESDMEWAQNLGLQSREKTTFDKIKEIMKEPGFDQEKAKEALKPRPALQIFVSSSMPIELLKKYTNEAKKYNGVLVLRDCLNGSMMEFILKTAYLSQESSGIQIDDEAFEAFKIDKVPAIILAQPVSIIDSKNHLIKFDKISGNISIKGALEKFSENNGDMSEEARNLLK
ncbi:MAG UNVERIFIED_CONTAM: type-F conjugative transfer system pilin assembly protein TrbC [Rickettsiaceae bacterium]